MPKNCPKCGEEIDYLDHLYSQRVHERYHDSGELEWRASYDADDPDERFECPICDETIAKTMSEAMDFWGVPEETDGTDEEEGSKDGEETEKDNDGSDEESL